MEKVHYSWLNDAEHYFENFNRKEYKDWNQDEFKKVFKEKYNSMLPIDLLTWCRVNEPEDKMIYKQGYWDQIMFVRDKLPEIWYDSNKDSLDDMRYNISVISTHRSKSILLPVYEIKIPKYNLTFVMRYNFYNWKISIESGISLDLDFMGLFDPNEKINNTYCEGFPSHRIYSDYFGDSMHKNFTVEIWNDYQVYTLMMLVINYMRKYYID